MSKDKKPDEELKKAFAELQEKVLDTRQKLKFSDMQIENLKRTKQRAELTQTEIKALPPNTRVFESVGRMFLLQDMSTIRSDLEQRTKLADEKINQLESNKTYLQNSLKDSENNLREMVQKKQAA